MNNFKKILLGLLLPTICLSINSYYCKVVFSANKPRLDKDRNLFEKIKKIDPKTYEKYKLDNLLYALENKEETLQDLRLLIAYLTDCNEKISSFKNSYRHVEMEKTDFTFRTYDFDPSIYGTKTFMDFMSQNDCNLLEFLNSYRFANIFLGCYEEVAIFFEDIKKNGFLLTEEDKILTQYLSWIREIESWLDNTLAMIDINIDIYL